MLGEMCGEDGRWFCMEGAQRAKLSYLDFSPEGRGGSTLGSVTFAVRKLLWLLWGGPVAEHQAKAEPARWVAHTAEGAFPRQRAKAQASLAPSCASGHEDFYWRRIPRCTCPHLTAHL